MAAEPNAIPPSNRIKLPPGRDDAQRLGDTVLEAVAAAGYPRAAQFAIRLALEEAVVNAFKHGHRELPDDVPIHVEYDVTPERVHIAVQDQGPGFDPGRVPDPTLDENLEVPSGRGLMLIRAYMTEAHHNDAGNRLEMTFEAHAEEPDDD